MGAGAQAAAQAPSSSQFLKEVVFFAGWSSCPDGEGMDRGSLYREAIAGTARVATEGRRSEDNPMQPPSSQLLSMRPFEGQYSMPMLYG